MAALSFAFPVPATFQQKLDAVEAFRAIPSDQEALDDLDMPEVVMLGKQACGKSSILEGIAGIGFPRGENFVTRGPVSLRLRRDPTATTPFAIVSLDPMDYSGEKIFDLDGGVEQSIRQVWEGMFAETDVAKAPLTDSPIFVTVFRQSGISLNLKDLPGIAEQGDTSDARKLFLRTSTEIARKHILNARAIIVLVVPATERDFANSSAVTLALECDPKRTRTLGVMTSIDCVNEEDLFQLVMRRIEGDSLADVRLPLGWTAVKCRSETQRKEKIAAEVAEATYFEQGCFGKRVPASHRSLKVLVERICHIQEPSLASWIPVAQGHVEHRLFGAKEELDRLEEGETTSLDDFRWKITSIIYTVADNLTKLIKAEDIDDRHELHVCARVHDLFKQFKQAMLEDLTSFFTKVESKTPETQSTAAGGGYRFVKDSIAAVQGAHREEFISPLADRRITGHFLRQTLRKHTQVLLSGIQSVLTKVVAELWKEHMACFPNVSRRLAPDCTRILLELAKDAKNLVFAVVEAEEEGDFTQPPSLQITSGSFVANGSFSIKLLAATNKYWPQCQQAQVNAILQQVGATFALQPLVYDNSSFSEAFLAAMRAYWPQCEQGIVDAILKEAVTPTFPYQPILVTAGQHGCSRVDQHAAIAFAYCLKAIERCGDVIPLLLKQHFVNKAPQFIKQNVACRMQQIGYNELMKTQTQDSKQQGRLQTARDLVSSLQTAKAALAECPENCSDADVLVADSILTDNH
mmetsp:Transcript_51685/g.102769  ORF Transcript_51685/g.102769 Transcript_51685/m.102769 type:complete len:748 (-) Transcript_51685:930-3173(-)